MTRPKSGIPVIKHLTEEEYKVMSEIFEVKYDETLTRGENLWKAIFEFCDLEYYTGQEKVLRARRRKLNKDLEKKKEIAESLGLEYNKWLRWSTINKELERREKEKNN